MAIRTSIGMDKNNTVQFMSKLNFSLSGFGFPKQQNQPFRQGFPNKALVPNRYRESEPKSRHDRVESEIAEVGKLGWVDNE